MTAIDSMAGLPAFALYFLSALALLGGSVAIYVWFTPHREIALIRAGNTAAAVSLGGAVIGFALPLASAVAHSVSMLDMLIWSAVALVAQLLSFLGARLVIPGISGRVRDGQMASGVFLGAVAVAIGLLNASAMTY